MRNLDWDYLYGNIASIMNKGSPKTVLWVKFSVFYWDLSGILELGSPLAKS